MNWRGIGGTSIGHATRQQQTTQENTCEVSCESASRCFQPGEDPSTTSTSSRGLLRDCGNLMDSVQLYYSSI